MFFKKLLLAVLGVAATMPVIASAEVITLSTDQAKFASRTLNQGWWSAESYNDDTNDNHLTGFLGSEYRSFYTFDLSTVNGKIKSATLNITRGGQTGDVTLSLWDVSTSAAIVNRNTGINNEVFADLGSGNSYGVFVAGYSTNMWDRLDFELNSQGIKDMRKQSGYFTIGASVVGSQNQYMFGYTGGDHSFLTLEVDPADVPEPSSIALIGLAMAGLAFNRRRKA